MKQAPVCLALAWLVSTFTLGASTEAQAPMFEDIGREYLEAAGLDPAKASIDELFQAGLARIELGAFELATPAAGLADRDLAERFQLAARTIVDIQRTWVETVDPEGERVDPKALRSDVKTVDKWIRDWKHKDLSGIEPGDDLGARLPAKDKVSEALARINAGLSGAGLPGAAGPEEAGTVEAGAGLGDGSLGDGGVTHGEESEAKPAAPEIERARLVLMPDRSGFVRFGAALGLLTPSNRTSYWSAGMPDWVEFRWNEDRVIALEFADTNPSTWDGGLPMDVHNERGLEEQVAQLAFGSLVLARFENRIDPNFSLAFCNNLVIDHFGEVDTRTDGDLRPRTAPPRAVFVPGGLSHGGRLPRNDADSRWRSTRGSDRFRAVLAEAQRAGAKKAKAKKARDRFLLLNEDQSRSFVARAPFFGAAAANTEIPSIAFEGDWLEFQRAYRAAFCHFLRVAGAGGDEESRAAFAQLLARLEPADDAGFAAAVEASYGLPVSSAEPGEDDLEGRFLDWIAKKR